MKTALALILSAATLSLAGPAAAAGWQGSFNASYQAASPGETIVVPAGTYGSQNITWIPGRDTAAPVKFVPAGPVTINGEMDISASGVWIAGTATGTMQNWKARTYSITVTSDVEIWGEGPSNYPRNVTVEGIDTRNLAVRSADNVTVRDMDVGPRLIDAPGCGPFENRIGANGSSGHAPNGVLWERVAVHDQNRTQAAANQDCHYGGLQWDFSQNVTIKDSVFERNVVYQVEVTGATNSTITGTSFSCPADNSWLGDRCDGQRPVQFRQGTWASFTLTNNLSANGPGGFYGCYESPCNFTGMTVSGNTDFPASTTAPTRATASWLGSFNASYQAASPGATVTVPAGTYPAETISGTKDPAVSFTMGGPVTVNGTLRIEANGLNLMGGQQTKVTYLLVWGGRNVKADGIDGTHFDVFETPGPVAITNGDWGPCQAPRDDPSCLSRVGSGNNVLIEGNSFHNITSTDLANYHVDGMAIFGGANNVVRRNRYFGNMITNIRVQNCCGNPAITNLLIEGNSFEAAVSGQGAKNGNGIDVDNQIPGLKIRFNSFEQGTFIGWNTSSQPSSVEVTGNLYSHVSCLPGVTYSYNVFVPWSAGQGQSACSATDTKVSTLGYAVFPGLAGGALGIDKGGPSCFALDLNGNSRPQGSACDAGAVETGGGPPPPPVCTGSGGTSPLTITKLSETATTITFGWTPVPGAIGYRFATSVAGSRYSTTNDPFRSSVKFSKIAAGGCYYILTQMPGAGGGFPA